MQLAAELITRYDHCAPFCKSNSDVRTMQCRLTHAGWHRDDRLERYEFRIGADRFLRGMVRLIVGTCLQIGLGKVAIEDLKDALDKQVLLKKPLSVPPEGLFLTEIRY
jgi:tRNA pseudouridine38-40 synthase